MGLTTNEIEALRSLLKLEINEALIPLEKKLDQKFDTVLQQIEGLYHRDERREQEFFFMKEQLNKHEKRISNLERKF